MKNDFGSSNARSEHTYWFTHPSEGSFRLGSYIGRLLLLAKQEGLR